MFAPEIAIKLPLLSIGSTYPFALAPRTARANSPYMGVVEVEEDGADVTVDDVWLKVVEEEVVDVALLDISTTG